ncbi:hypothetical protein Patl1_33143 [Pistacia atlantica]|uniref:Uncharacterized protein n=1 Tax=Pistacia atlantica TaxID=434234 RepID=A0ACC1ARF9_9ROSI|nr:hypothetical protein Patl1_33143 [Pistacia atlantica]
MKFAGVMVVLVHLDILSIIESCFVDWWKVLGTGKYGTLQPLAPPNPMEITLFEGKQKHVIINFVLHLFSTSVLLLQSFQYLLLHFTPASNSLLLIFYYCCNFFFTFNNYLPFQILRGWGSERERAGRKVVGGGGGDGRRGTERPWMDEFVLLAV